MHGSVQSVKNSVSAVSPAPTHNPAQVPFEKGLSMPLLRHFVLTGLASLCLFLGSGTARAELLRETGLSLGSGYRRAELSWNIAGNRQGTNPDVLSELEWKNLDIFQAQAESHLRLGLHQFPNLSLLIKGSLSWGWIVAGNNRDSDYAGDGRTLEFSRSENSGKGGDLLDLSVALGPQLQLFDNSLELALLAGWSYHEQNLKIRRGRQTLSEPGLTPNTSLPQPLGRFPGLDSRYETRWWGPWLGTDLHWLPTAKLSLSGSFAWHFADYQAKADWNLRSDLAHPVSFRHWADGSGLVLALGLHYRLTPNWRLALDYQYQDWVADKGLHRIYRADGGRAESRLNKVNWRSRAAMLSLCYLL